MIKTSKRTASSAVTVAITVVLIFVFVAACLMMNHEPYDTWRYQTDTGRHGHD